ncbi:hypothetical protein Tco_0825398 [Tanacetum coccineum]
MKIMINEESDISDYEEEDLNKSEDESSSDNDNKSEICDCIGNWMSSDKKIVLPKPRLPTPFVPRLPSPPSPITQTQNRFIHLTPYPPTTSPIARPTYLALAHMQDGIPSFEYTLQFSATFKLPWILSFTHKKKEAEGTSPPLLIRQFSAKWWKVIKESQADKLAVARYHKSLMPRTTSVSPSSSASGSTMTNKEIAQRIKDYSNNEALLEKFINEIRGSPTPSENLFQDSQDPYENENFLNM